MADDPTSTKSKKYSAVKTRIFVIDILITVISLGVFQCFFARSVSRLSYEVSPNFYLAALVFSLVFLAFLYLASFPTHIMSSFFVEKRFSLSRQTFIGWLKDEGKSVVLSLVLSVGCIEVFYLILRNFPHSWWVITAAAWIFFSIVMARFMPVLLIPLFYKYLPLEDDDLKDRILKLADRSGINLMDVCRIDLSRKTSKANAALVGLGKTRKVILGDTLTENFTLSEVEAVVAHEFAHFKKRHMVKLLTSSAVVTLLGFFVLFIFSGRIAELMGASGFSELYLLPVITLLLSVFGIMLMPFQNFLSRVLEREADTFALRVTASPDAFISVMRKLGEMNLADIDPPLVKKIFLYDHPPIKERIMMAERFAEGG
ncbi:M48 family metallopeptidase [Candidatus Omnitrophota bacterium]